MKARSRRDRKFEEMIGEDEGEGEGEEERKRVCARAKERQLVRVSNFALIFLCRRRAHQLSEMGCQETHRLHRLVTT